MVSFTLMVAVVLAVAGAGEALADPTITPASDLRPGAGKDSSVSRGGAAAARETAVMPASGPNGAGGLGPDEGRTTEEDGIVLPPDDDAFRAHLSEEGLRVEGGGPGTGRW